MVMAMAKGRRPGAGPAKARQSRTYNTRLIKRDYSYAASEIVALLKIHENTVGNWHADGLPPIDDRRPLLFHGSDLIEFLSRRQERRRHVCGPGEFFCCKCRAPRPPWERAVDVEIRDARRLILKAVCSVCGTAMNRIGAVRQLDEFRTRFDFQTVTDLRLKG